MPLTRDQQQAVRDLRRLDAADSTFRLAKVEDDVVEGGDLLVVVEVDVSDFEQRDGGFPMEDWERIAFAIPPEFPYRPPTAHVGHSRWEGREHVVWGTLCLYRATDVEWDPSFGMLGYVKKLEDWLRDAAAGTLDPVGVPLHPPAAFPARADAATIVVRADTPEVTDAGWFGFAQLKRVRDDRFDLVGWHGGNPHGMAPPIACARLTRGSLSGVYPRYVGQLLQTLEDLGASIDEMKSGMKDALRVTPQGSELIVIVGTEQRGVVGEAMLPHLTAWRIDPSIADHLRTLWVSSEDVDASTVEELHQWLASAQADWCHVQDDRNRVTVRRDMDTPMSFFQSKAVEIWGCGAVGGWLAEMLARAGLRRLVLRDRSRVTIGSLVRQPYTDADVGKPKTDALTSRLEAIDPRLDVEPHNSDIVEWLNAGARPDDVDLVINATASRVVDSVLERAAPLLPTVPVATIGMSGTASVGRVVLCPSEHSAGPVDGKRKARLQLDVEPTSDHLLEAFWRTTQAPFVPEPGCSEPTFAGSAADVLTLVAPLLDQLARRLGDSPQHAAVGFITSAISAHGPAAHWLGIPSDTTLNAEGYRIMLAPQAREAILAEMKTSAVDRGQVTETGGLLFGELDDAARRIWVTVATGPPADSTHHPRGFICGTRGTRRWANTLRRTHGDAVTFVGTWHTHPGGVAHPSSTDYTTMKKLVEAADTNLDAGLLLIAGGSHDDPTFGAQVLWEEVTSKT